MGLDVAFAFVVLLAIGWKGLVIAMQVAACVAVIMGGVERLRR